jgi:hypothetical protein
MTSYFHTTSKRLAKRVWEALGGIITHVRRTGEVRYDHPYFSTPLRANDRRHDPPSKLISRINQLRRELGGEVR